MQITPFPFDKAGHALLAKKKKSADWSVVYLISNDKELYIGETQNALARFSQHLENKDRRRLKKIHVIFDEEFNKSAILDIEQNLIQLCGADRKFSLQNMNGGQSCKHDYYQREKYLNKISEIWPKLRKEKLADHSLEELRNSDLFKYSPYSSLTPEQNEASDAILLDMMEKLQANEKGVALLEGGAGTGKTIVLINLLFKLIHASSFEVSPSGDEEEEGYAKVMHEIRKYLSSQGIASKGKKSLKIAYVCPMTSLRKTMTKVFQGTGNGLKGSLVKGPFDVLDEEYDVVLVDEAHRLARRKNISFMGAFDEKAMKLGLDPKEADQLQMILRKARYAVLVYDPKQSVKGSDIPSAQFRKDLEGLPKKETRLFTQMRCEGGEEYVSYLERILSCQQAGFEEVEDYDFRLYEDVERMVQDIKELDGKIGLCRNAAGYSWKWVSKPYLKKGYDYVVSHGLSDIHIQGHDYVWNMTNQEFILSKNAVNEIGCIHTLQGYDLNYVGLIFGEEIDYDPAKNEIVIDRAKFFDSNVKSGSDEETLRSYILNSYKVIMTRGIKGCYVYACNPNLRDYLKRFIKEKENGKAQ